MICLAAPALSQQCPTPADAYKLDKDTVPLCLVTAKIKETLDKYNSDPTAGKTQLPTLTKAAFGFKTTRTTSGGFSLNLFIFKIGTTRQSDTSEEVTFAYEKPKSNQGTLGFHPKKTPHDFSENLLSLLKSSATQVKAAQKFGDLPLSSLTLNLSFGVTWEVSAGVTAPVVAMVTAAATFDRKMADVQTVQLTYGPRYWRQAIPQRTRHKFDTWSLPQNIPSGLCAQNCMRMVRYSLLEVSEHVQQILSVAHSSPYVFSSIFGRRTILPPAG